MTTTSPRPTETESIQPIPRPANEVLMVASIQALIVANLVQVLAGFTGADPSPPPAVVPGIAATALLGIAALPMIRDGLRMGLRLGIAFCLASMVGMGPHKLLLDDGAVIAPMALVGFAFEITFLVHATRALRTDR